MKKSEMRVLIAKDVIKWLKAGKFKAKQGIYVRIDTDGRDDAFGSGDDAKTALNLKTRESCTVCQRGALLLAAIDRFDACKLGYGYDVSDRLNDMAGWNAEITQDGIGGLSCWFNENQYGDMEGVFESQNRNWNKAYRNATARMDAICRNLIAHEGVFVASDIPKPRRNPYWTKKR